jgi:hypothetical protein
VSGTPQVRALFLFIFNRLPMGIRRATICAMFAARFLSASVCLVLLLASGVPEHLSAGQTFVREAAETNVNQRYTIESVAVGGVPVDRAKLPVTLRSRLLGMVGARCDMATIGDLSSALRKELHLRSVSEHLSRGSQPDQIRVNFEVVKRDISFDVSVPKFLYHSKQGWTGELDASTRVGQNTFTLGAVSNGDDLSERFTGIAARYQTAKVFTDKLRFALNFEDFHEQWSDSTRRAVRDTPNSDLDLYRSRRNVAPELTFAPVKNFSISTGMSFEQMESETPALGLRSANAATGEVRYGRTLEGLINQRIDGKYNIRLGMHGLGSDFQYARHAVSVRYELKSGRQIATDEFLAGAVSGSAPMFENFVLGTSSTLRGWDRNLINPLGGNRVIHNSLSYGYQIGEGTAEIFYDTGALWRHGKAPLITTGGVRHSVGVGYRQGNFVLTMAFPVVEGRVTPVFMAGMNY